MHVAVCRLERVSKGRSTFGSGRLLADEYDNYNRIKTVASELKNFKVNISVIPDIYLTSTTPSYI